MSERDISRILGRIEATTALILEEQKRDRLEFKEIRQSHEEIKRRQEAAEKERSIMSERLKEVEKNTADFNKWKERGVGAIMLISIAAALVGGSLAATWHKILEVFR